ASSSISISAAGTSPLSGKGVLLFIRFQLKVPGGITFSFINGTNGNYFNQGNPVMDFVTVTLSILTPPSIYAYSGTFVPLTIVDSLQVYLNGVTAPYSFSVTNPVVATIDTTGKLRAIAAGKTKVRVQSADNLVDTVDQEVEI